MHKQLQELENVAENVKLGLLGKFFSRIEIIDLLDKLPQLKYQKSL